VHASQSTDFAEWIRQLDADGFTQRSEASRNLEGVGKAAFPALAEAALGDSREVTLRAIDILRKQYQQGDEASKAAAKGCLEKLAQSDHPSAARRAKEALEPPKQPLVVQPGGVFPQLPLAPQQIQIQINAVAGNQVRRIEIRNGVRQIEATDGDTKVKIVEDPNGGIQMEVTEKKNGQEATNKVSAKNTDDLKKNHPDVYKLYEKHANQQGGIQIQAIQVQPGGIPANLLPRPQDAVREQLRKSAVNRLQQARRLVETTGLQLQQLKAVGHGGDELDKTMQRLDTIKQQLQEEEARLSKAE
jgi:hypothetical protein